MKRVIFVQMALVIVLSVLLCGCSQKVTANAKSEEPPPAEVQHEQDGSLIRVDHPERFPLAAATRHTTAPELNVTGVISADVARNVPVVSMAAGRVLEVRARLGDYVTKDQLLIRVQSTDIANAFSEYRQAVADERLARAQLKRSRILYEKGAIAQKDLEVIQEAEEKADVAVETTIERLQVLGADKDHPTPVVDITAPVSGVITDQQVTAASGTQGLASPNAFTISDLSHVWILCDVYENDLALVHVGEFADIRLAAYPKKRINGRISNIGAILDPSIRTAKVRIEVENPGLMRLGMFVQATFHGQPTQSRVVIPASAVLRLHDRDWVYEPNGASTFRRVEVRSGRMISRGWQEIVSGIQPGDQVVENVLFLQNATDQ